MTLRYYQQDAHDAAIAWIKKSKESCLIEAETGAGKSHMIAAISKTFYEISGKHVLCTAPNVDLIYQNREKYIATGNPASVFSASIGKSLRHPVTFGTPVSIHNQIEKFGDKFGLICIDECHGITPTIKNIINEIKQKNNNLRVIGLSATPYRLGTGLIYGMDEYDKPSRESECVDPYFAKKVYTIGGRELIEQGFLTPPVIGAIHGDHYDTSKFRINSMGKFYKEDIDKAYHGKGRKTARIIEDIIAQSQYRRGVMIFAATVQHAMECMESLPPELSRMIGGDINTGKEQRQRIVQDFKNKKYKYQVSVGTMTTGVDFTHVDVIALLAPSESTGGVKQRVGRGLRLEYADGYNIDLQDQRLLAIANGLKPDCLVLDYCGAIDMHFPDGDIFNPQIKAYSKKYGSKTITAICPQCSTENEFSARKNDDGFAIDDNGYFIDLMGERINTDFGPMPAHMGRRCYGQTLIKGEFVRCGYFWSHKECPECFEKADLSARYCPNGHELIDPNKPLIGEFVQAKRDPYSIQTDKVITWHQKKTLTKKGENMLVVDWITEYRKFPIFFLVRRPEYGELMKATQGGDVMPQSITYRKDQKSGFFRVLGYNQGIKC